MAKSILTPYDFNKLEIRQFVLHLLSSAPGSPVEGQPYYNTTSHCVEFWNGTAWITLGTLDQIDAPAADVSMASHKITNLTTPSTGSDAANKTYVDGQTLNGIATRTAATADITASGFKITNVGTPTVGTDAVTKTYADALVAGISSWKSAVRAATTANGTLATAYENGDVIDGVTLATGDRILLKNQTTGGENGIYTVNASGAPTRTTDADAGTELIGAGVFVDEGTTNADSSWVNTTNGPITLGTTATVWVQFSGAGQITSGAGLTKTGNTLDVGAGNGISVAADSIAVDLSVVVDKTTAQTLTNKTLTAPVLSSPTGLVAADIPVLDAAKITTGTMATARLGSGTADATTFLRGDQTYAAPPGGRFAVDVGDGSTTSIVITHNLGTLDVIIQVYVKGTTGALVECDIQHTTTNTATLVFAVAPTSAQYRAICHS